MYLLSTVEAPPGKLIVQSSHPRRLMATKSLSSRQVRWAQELSLSLGIIPGSTIVRARPMDLQTLCLVSPQRTHAEKEKLRAENYRIFGRLPSSPTNASLLGLVSWTLCWDYHFSIKSSSAAPTFYLNAPVLGYFPSQEYSNSSSLSGLNLPSYTWPLCTKFSSAERTSYQLRQLRASFPIRASQRKFLQGQHWWYASEATRAVKVNPDGSDQKTGDAKESHKGREEIAGVLHHQGLPNVIKRNSSTAAFTTTFYLGFDKTQELTARKDY